MGVARGLIHMGAKMGLYVHSHASDAVLFNITWQIQLYELSHTRMSCRMSHIRFLNARWCEMFFILVHVCLISGFFFLPETEKLNTVMTTIL